MPQFRAINAETGQTQDYEAAGPDPAHLQAPWTVAEVVPLQVVEDPNAPPTPPPVVEWTPFVFIRRFSQAERVAIRAARLTDGVLGDFFSILEQAPLVHSNDADFQAGMQYLVQQGLLTAERAAEIVSA
jgi:hypothetical protein